MQIKSKPLPVSEKKNANGNVLLSSEKVNKQLCKRKT